MENRESSGASQAISFECDTLVVRAKADGREYVLNIYTKSRRMAFSYMAPLPTMKDEWTEVSVPLDEFIPTAFGRRVQSMGPVEPDQINGLGFMLRDKQPGAFQLEVGWVKILPASGAADGTLKPPRAM